MVSPRHIIWPQELLLRSRAQAANEGSQWMEKAAVDREGQSDAKGEPEVEGAENH